MKRCPECRRDYYDDSLLYCLDDGSALLEGPATGGGDEPATAMLVGTDTPTRPLIHSTDDTAVLPETGETAGRKRRSNRKITIILFAALALAAAAGIVFGIYKYGIRQAAVISFETAKITRLTNSGEVTGRTAISPDGKWLVYANQDGEQQSLWLKQVAIPDSNTQIVPPAAVRFTGLAFSPDGNYLYYTVREPTAATGTLYQVPVLGGTARKLFTGIWDRVSFSPDAKQIAYFDYIDDEDRLMIANADGSGQRQLAMRKGNEFFVQDTQIASWSPDGKTIATTLGTEDPRFMSVATVSVATGEIDPFCPQKFDWTGGVTWLADGKSMLVLASENVGVPEKIWQISYPSGEARKISNDLDRYTVISLTADSNALATVRYDSTANIWIIPINDTAHATQVSSGSDITYSPSWTPVDKLVCARITGGTIDLFIVDQRGGSQKQLTSNAGANYSPTASPDGSSIVFVSTRAGTSSLWRIDMDGGNPQRLTDTSASNPNFSPDGQQIIYEMFANKSTIWKVGIDGGQPVQLTDKESTTPVFSPDGKLFACLLRDDTKSPYKLAIIPSSGGPPVNSFALPADVNVAPRWMPDGRSIAYIVNKGLVGNIWSQGISGGTPKQLTNFTSETINSFDISRDGKQIAVSRGTVTSDVVLISGIKK